MAEVTKKEPEDSFISRIIRSWDSLAKIGGVLLAILIAGFKAGSYYKGNQAEMEKIRLEQECNARIQKIENDLSNAKIEEYERAVDNLTEVIKQVKTDNHER